MDTVIYLQHIKLWFLTLMSNEMLKTETEKRRNVHIFEIILKNSLWSVAYLLYSSSNSRSIWLGSQTLEMFGFCYCCLN